MGLTKGKLSRDAVCKSSSFIGVYHKNASSFSGLLPNRNTDSDLNAVQKSIDLINNTDMDVIQTVSV